MTIQDRAAAFRSLHSDVLVLPNAWDAASARLVQEAGASAIATTSGGIAWSLGAPDGHGADPTAVVDAVRRIVSVVDVPVTADIEGGFGQVGEVVAAVLDAGAVGINLEDSAAGSLIEVDTMTEHLESARRAAEAAGVPLYVNARTDTFLAGDRDLDETVTRARAYVAAGADGIFVPGLTDLDDIADVARAVEVPLNVMAGPGSPSVAALVEAGARRISTGTALAEAAYALTERLARTVLTEGQFGVLDGGVDYGRMNALFGRG